MGRTSEGTGRCFVWEVQELVPSLPLSDRLLRLSRIEKEMSRKRKIQQLSLRHLQHLGKTIQGHIPGGGKK